MAEAEFEATMSLSRTMSSMKSVQTRGQLRRSSSMSIPSAHGSSSFGNLEDLNPKHQQNKDGLRRRCSITDLSKVVEEVAPASAGFWSFAMVSVVLGVMSVVPYNMVLASDAGSPLFISFVTHIFFVTINIEQVGVMLRGERKIPLLYHAAFVGLGFLFNFLKSDAFTRLPTSMCMLLMNLQMLVGMVVQRIALGKHYSFGQLGGCALVTSGVALAAAAKPAAKSAATAAIPMADLIVGTSEMVGALLALTVLSLLVKAAFSQYGESVGEQLFMQHLFGLPLFFLGGQWQQIGPRAVEWAGGNDWWKICLLVVNMALTFGDRKCSVKVVSRAPNVLIVQLLETLKKFLSMLLCAVLAAPPLPTLGFWAGAALLGLGTLQYLSASDAPEEDEKED